MEERQILEYGRSAFVKVLFKKTQEMMNEKDLNEETIRDVERMIVLSLDQAHQLMGPPAGIEEKRER